jgi:hypothetical protein
MKPMRLIFAKRKGGNQTDVWTFRCFDGTEAAVVRVVNVTNFEILHAHAINHQVPVQKPCVYG